jgi:hypothetical protein
LENVATTPDVHHHIGVSQNHFEHIGTFLRTHAEDLAVKVMNSAETLPSPLLIQIQDFLPKLKSHLLPQIKTILASENAPISEETSRLGTSALQTSTSSELNNVIFKHDQFYCHNIMRINYTTYDIRRKQDTINPATPHRNVIVSTHSFMRGLLEFSMPILSIQGHQLSIIILADSNSYE